MINVLSYIGMNMRSELCLWTLLGIIRTIFDATLFRVNANLKQVWQMAMPTELSMSVQRVLRTMISGVMLVQCFTVYVYLASYIVLLYPVFLEERPSLVLPWLLLAAIRKLLCELTSLALGLGTCILLGPAKPPCIKFLIIKVISIMPSFYLWMLLFSYYHTLKVAAAFKTFSAGVPAGDQDYGLELAIRRRRTKSLLGEEQLRSKIVASLYGEKSNGDAVTAKMSKMGISSRMVHSTDTNAVEIVKEEPDVMQSFSSNANYVSETGSFEDWFGSEVVLPRGCDRILEQFVLMLLRIKLYLDKEGEQSVTSQMLNRLSQSKLANYENLNCADETETSFLVGSSKNSNTASYLQEYPQIFMKKPDVHRNDSKVLTTTIESHQENEDNGNISRTRKRTVTVSSKEKNSYEIEKVVSQKKYLPDDTNHQEHKMCMASSRELMCFSKEITYKTAEVGKKSGSANIKNGINVDERHDILSQISLPSNKDNVNDNLENYERDLDENKQQPHKTKKNNLTLDKENSV